MLYKQRNWSIFLDSLRYAIKEIKFCTRYKEGIRDEYEFDTRPKTSVLDANVMVIIEN